MTLGALSGDRTINRGELPLDEAPPARAAPNVGPVAADGRQWGRWRNMSYNLPVRSTGRPLIGAFHRSRRPPEPASP
jgi:hypothetical protein